MTKRREFLQAATALSAAPLVGWNAVGWNAVAGERAVTGERKSPVFDAVIFDSRHTQSLEFADRAAQLGAPVHGINADITDVWRGHLLNRWKETPNAVAGLTERPALFLLERLAWDHGLRVVFEAEHALEINGRGTHRIIRTADANLARALENVGSNWPSTLADNLVESSNTPARDFRPSEAAMAAYLGEPTKLYSWIIAPRTV